MSNLWDYDAKTLKKSKSGRVLLLERMINFGPGSGKKVKLSEVKKNWNKLHLFPRQKRLFELLIWGEYSLETRKGLSPQLQKILAQQE